MREHTPPPSTPSSPSARFTPHGLRPLLDEHEAAAYLHLSVHTLRAWRSMGQGPSFHRFGRRIRYTHEGLEAFLRATIVEARPPEDRG